MGNLGGKWRLITFLFTNLLIDLQCLLPYTLPHVRNLSRWVFILCSLAIGLVSASACTDTRFYSLEWNADTVASNLEVLFPELLFEFDSGTRILKGTGCKSQLDTMEPLIKTANKGDVARWQAEVEKRLWNANGALGIFKHSVFGFQFRKPSGDWKLASLASDPSVQQAGGKPIFGLTFAQKNARQESIKDWEWTRFMSAGLETLYKTLSQCCMKMGIKGLRHLRPHYLS